MDNDLLMKASFLQKQAEELEQNIGVIDKELAELNELDKNISFLMASNGKSSISSIGKGIHVKTSIESKELLVEVGAGVVVKKSPAQAREIIDNQITKLAEARNQIMGKIEIYQRTFEDVVREIEESESKVLKNN